MIKECENIVFFGGAGVSTESGVKDYRSQDGLYNTVKEYGGIMNPLVVLYEEPLYYGVAESAVNYISKADMLIVGGTSLAVYPAASFVEYFRGKYIVIINKSETSFDKRQTL